MNFLVKALIVIAAVIGSSLIGIGVKKIKDKQTDTTASTQSDVNTIQPAVATSPKAQVEVGKKVIKQLDLTDKQVLTIYGPIGEESYYVAKKLIELGKSGKPLYILINSPGGSVLDGALVVSAIEGSPVPVYTICEQLCASMAAIIHAYGHKRMMVDRSMVMYHPASGGLQGSFPQMQSRFKTIDRYVNKFDAYIAKRAGLQFEQFVSMLNNELWLDAEDATNQKLNDEIVNVRLPVTIQQSPEFLKSRQANPVKEKVNVQW